MDLNDMKKICVNLYGGKSLFSKKETPLEADEIFCSCADSCSFYKQGKCLNCRSVFGDRCPNGKVVMTKGYTSHARKYSKFSNRYTNDELYNTLEYPETSYFGIIGNAYWFNLKYFYMKKATETDEKHFTRCGYIISTSYATSFFHVPIEDVNLDLLHEIFSYRPRTIDFQEIKDYQVTVVPHIVTSMKMTAPELYSALTEKYPEYMKDKYTPNYIGMYAYTRTLKNGSVIKDCHGNEGILKDGKIYCENFTKGFVPFNGKSASVIVELDDKSVNKITDNSQVDENTNFR